MKLILARLSILHRGRRYLQSFWKFAEILKKVSISVYIDELKIKYILKLYFSQTLKFTGFFAINHYSNVYKLVEYMFLAVASDFIANWYWKKQRNLVAMN